jgi:sterol desaturase/sphingolipid hydroxylase (fatty acid hydroxylase superfamily)
METTAYYAFGVPLYVLLVVGEYLVARRRRHATLSFAPSVGNITAGLGSIVVGLFLGPALLLLYSFGEAHIALVHWPKGSPITWVLAFVLADFGHYWHHRLDHRVAACWAVHGVHHMPEEMNFTVAMRHAWFSDLYSFPFYMPLPMLGVPMEQFFIATTALSVHALITHSAELRFPSLGFLVTPQSHMLHHAKNQPYVDKNFGAMLCIWDRIFGTAVTLDPASPPEWGTTRGYATHDGAKAQWVLWKDLLVQLGAAHGVAEKARVLFGRPEKQGLAPVVAPPMPQQISMGTKLYVAAQLTLTMVVSLWVFIGRDHHSRAVLVVSAILIIWAMSALAGLLDARPKARLREGIRLLVTAVAMSAASFTAFAASGMTP